MLTLEKLCYVQVLNSVGGPSVPEPLQASAPLAPRAGGSPRPPSAQDAARSRAFPRVVAPHLQRCCRFRFYVQPGRCALQSLRVLLCPCSVLWPPKRSGRETDKEKRTATGEAGEAAEEEEARRAPRHGRLQRWRTPRALPGPKLPKKSADLISCPGGPLE